MNKFWSNLEDKEYAHAYSDEFSNILIATQIKVLRGKLTQKQLAEKVGMAQERISLLENVNYSSWSINTLRKLAKAFDLRLRVTFESFSTLLIDMKRLNEDDLKCKSREQELRELSSVNELNQNSWALDAARPSADANKQKVSALNAQSIVTKPHAQKIRQEVSLEDKSNLGVHPGLFPGRRSCVQQLLGDIR